MTGPLDEKGTAMDWEEALARALELGGDTAYHPDAQVTLGEDLLYTVYSWKSGQAAGLTEDEVAEELESVGALDDNWSDE